MDLPQRLQNFKNSLGEQVLLGGMVGDSCLDKSKNRTALQLCHGIKQKEYLLWKVRILEESGMEFHSYSCSYGRDNEGKIRFCSKNSKIIPRYHSLYFLSKYYLELNDYYRMFYRGRQKIIRRKILNLFRPLALAIWYQDDGSMNKGDNMIRLCTLGFSEREQKMIKKYFKTVWHITTKIMKNNRGYYYLSFGVQGTLKLIDIIKPFIHPSMEYKIKLVPKISIEERNRRFKHSSIPYRFQKGQIQTNTGKTWFKTGHLYYPRKSSQRRTNLRV